MALRFNGRISHLDLKPDLSCPRCGNPEKCLLFAFSSLGYKNNDGDVIGDTYDELESERYCEKCGLKWDSLNGMILADEGSSNDGQGVDSNAADDER